MIRSCSRFVERLRPTGFVENMPLPLDLYVDDTEIWDLIDKRFIPRDTFREAMKSRARELEAAIRRFMDCGVELARFSVQEHPGESRLCIDGVPRFSWRLAQ